MMDLWARHKAFVCAICGACLFGGLGIYFASKRSRDLPEVVGSATSVSRDRTVEIGGVTRPLTDVESRGIKRSQTSEDEDDFDAGYGKTPQLDPESDPMLQSVFTTIQDGSKTSTPEVLGPMIAPPAYDREAYRADPETYLSQVVPGRVWQGAQPSKSVPVIRRVGSRSHTMKQGESLRLQVKTVPEAPVTFTSFDLGAFQNKLTSISVAADADGIAEAIFTATTGTIAEVNIVAASPEASGRVRFKVDVTRPQQL